MNISCHFKIHTALYEEYNLITDFALGNIFSLFRQTWHIFLHQCSFFILLLLFSPLFHCYHEVATTPISSITGYVFKKTKKKGSWRKHNFSFCCIMFEYYNHSYFHLISTWKIIFGLCFVLYVCSRVDGQKISPEQRAKKAQCASEYECSRTN